MRISPQALGTMHFIGIGGIGMSGIAEILHHLDYKVQGSDLNQNYNTQRLTDKGIACYFGHDVGHLQGVRVVIVSSDIRDDNIELIHARQNRVPIVQRAEMLAEIMRLRPSIAVAGTHGKTTTTSLGAWIMQRAALDPTVISGGIINHYGTNAKLGHGKWTIVEADESDGSFTKLPATHVIVTNIDPEHMNYYKSYEMLYQAFRRFVENIPFYGLAIVCVDNPGSARLAAEITDRRIITYGLNDGADVQAININYIDEKMRFDIKFSSHFNHVVKTVSKLETVTGFDLKMVGDHNVQNALSTIILALELGLDCDAIKAGLCSFEGVKRRYTRVAQWQGYQFIDDYAHHPVEVSAVIKAARLVNDQQLVTVFQPHRYTRLGNFMDDFAQALNGCDVVFVTPTYAAGEEPGPVDHTTLINAIQKLGHQNTYFIQNPHDLAHQFMKIKTSTGQVVFMGAGDITGWIKPTLNYIENQTGL